MDPLPRLETREHRSRFASQLVAAATEVQMLPDNEPYGHFFREYSDGHTETYEEEPNRQRMAMTQVLVRSSCFNVMSCI